MNKILLLASFIRKDNIEWFKNHLKNNFNISSDKIFYFDIDNDTSKIVVTFKLEIECGEKLDIKKHFKNTIPIHKKGSTLYTINALNKVIESESGLDLGNINYKSYKIDWSKFENTFILINANKLAFMSINRAFY